VQYFYKKSGSLRGGEITKEREEWTSRLNKIALGKKISYVLCGHLASYLKNWLNQFLKYEAEWKK
jgi:uracil-DNA glycosylase